MSLPPSCAALEPRPLPSTGVTRFPRYCGPFRHPARPDLALAGCRLACAAPPAGLPVLRPIPSSMHGAANTPAETVGACVARFPTAGSLPRMTGGSASAAFVSRPARRSLALRPAWSLSRPRRPFVIGVLQPMSLPPSSAPTATGWSDSCRAGFAPAEEWRLRTAHGHCLFTALASGCDWPPPKPAIPRCTHVTGCPIRLRKPGVPPRIAIPEGETPARTATRRRRERTILPHRHLVAAHRQTAARQHHHLRTRGAVPEHLTGARRRASPADAVPKAGADAPETREPEVREPVPPTRVPATAVVPSGVRSTVSRFCASVRNTPFGNCARYASKSAGFVLFMIDCQKRFSCAALAADAGAAVPAGDGGCAAGTGGDDAGATAATAGPDPPADRSDDADGPSRYPPSQFPGGPGPVELRLRPLPTAAEQPSRSSSPTAVGRQPPCNAPWDARALRPPTMQRP